MSLDDAQRRVIKIKGWRWLPGMLPTHGSRVIYAVGERAFVAYWDEEDEEQGGAHWFTTGIPDLTDWGTLGCLIELVQKAWGDEFEMLVNPSGYVEIMHIPTANMLFSVTKETLGEALVEALGAAP